MGDITTSDQSEKLYKCDVCRQRTPILVQGADRKRRCIDCLPEKDQAVFRGKSGA